jgi:hypothetical protein
MIACHTDSRVKQERAKGRLPLIGAAMLPMRRSLITRRNSIHYVLESLSGAYPDGILPAPVLSYFLGITATYIVCVTQSTVVAGKLNRSWPIPIGGETCKITE